MSKKLTIKDFTESQSKEYCEHRIWTFNNNPDIRIVEFGPEDEINYGLRCPPDLEFIFVSETIEECVQEIDKQIESLPRIWQKIYRVFCKHGNEGSMMTKKQYTLDDFHAPDIDGWRFLKGYPNISIREPHTDNTGWWVSVKIDTPVFNMDNVKLSQTFSWKRSVKTYVKAMELAEAGVGLTKSLGGFSK